MIDAPATLSEPRVLDALRHVIDPELDESIVELGFVDSVRVRAETVDVVLRLPTFWCAPNFAYLMASDAREEILRRTPAREVRVALKDHMYSDEIGVGVTAGLPFDEVFAGQTENDDLDGLRGLFRVKAFGMRQEQLVRFLLRDGLTPDEIADLRVSDVTDTSDRTGLRLLVDGRARLFRGGAPLARTYLERRQRLNLAGNRLIVTPAGQPVRGDALQRHLLDIRRQRISITFNTLMCKGLLETRYGLNKAEER